MKNIKKSLLAFLAISLTAATSSFALQFGQNQNGGFQFSSNQGRQGGQYQQQGGQGGRQGSQHQQQDGQGGRQGSQYQQQGGQRNPFQQGSSNIGPFGHQNQGDDCYDERNFDDCDDDRRFDDCPKPPSDGCYEKPKCEVPDTGLTLSMLGFSLVGLAAVRRRLRK